MEHENLYSSLGYCISTCDLTHEEKDTLISSIETFDIERKKVFYLLILHDFIKHNPTSKVIFPYKSKQLNDRIEIKLDTLPIHLKQILYKFVKLAQVSKTENEENTPIPISV